MQTLCTGSKLDMLPSSIPILLSVINARPVAPVVINEPPGYIQVQQRVGVESHKEVMNKSALTSGGALENITLCAPTV